MSIILGIDSSCDDSAVAVVKDGRVLSNIVASQNQIHRQYGGVFPTLAKLAHQQNLPAALEMALRQSRRKWSEINAVAVTQGPGLAPALEVGITLAKELAAAYKKPLIAVNHIEAHALSALLQPAAKKNPGPNHWQNGDWPKLALIISGGHSEFWLLKAPGNYQKLGATIDDAAGECLDKVGRLLNLGYPAGPLIEQFAKQGRPERLSLPLPMTSQADFNLSFSGLKTAASRQISQLAEQGQLDRQATFDCAAAIQEAVFDHIVYKLKRILCSPDLAKGLYPKRQDFKAMQQQKLPLPTLPFQQVLLGGGVAANTRLRQKIRQALKQQQQLTGQSLTLQIPYSKKLCSDNAAMIALTAEIAWQKKHFVQPENLERRPNLSLS